MIAAWSAYLQDPKRRATAVATISLTGVMQFCFALFLSWNESRSGYRFPDPLLALFQPLDLSLPVFIITYCFGFGGLIIFARRPQLLVVILQSYCLLTLFRIGTLLLLPLEPPHQIIPLQDVLLESSFYSGRVNLKDLFFSGHTATLFLFYFSSEERTMRIAFAVAATVVGALLLAQHVHYSVDVFAAPLFAWMAVALRRKAAGSIRTESKR